MNPDTRLGFPFTIRDMLAFQHGAAFGLRIVSQSTSTAPVVIRGITSEGAFSFVHIPTSNSIIATENYRMTDLPIMITVSDKDGSLVQGDTYITLSLTVNGDVIQELCSGLVYRQKSISFPTTNSVDIIPNGGRLIEKTSTDPAAGSEHSTTVPAGQIWRVRAIRTSLVTDGNAANRRVHLKIQSGTNTIYNLFPLIDQTASLTWSYHWMKSGFNNDELDNLVVQAALPDDIWLIPADVIVTETLNLQATDNFGVMRIMVEQFFNPA